MGSGHNENAINLHHIIQFDDDFNIDENNKDSLPSEAGNKDGDADSPSENVYNGNSSNNSQDVSNNGSDVNSPQVNNGAEDLSGSPEAENASE